MLQKIVNGIAIASGVISLSVVGLGGYVFIRKDAIIENVKGQVMEAVSGKLGSLAGDALVPPHHYHHQMHQLQDLQDLVFLVSNETFIQHNVCCGICGNYFFSFRISLCMEYI